jgi:ectoine hydroxylase-related dioxygenase (phytanoyl-CoA dioxygenase family)
MPHNNNVEYLLDDDAMKAFITQGYHLIDPVLPAEFHQRVCHRIDTVFDQRGNPGNDIYDEVPDLELVYNHPVVRGALTSILGVDYAMDDHRHCHYARPGDHGGHWHQDSVNRRHHRIPVLLALYYPQDVTEDMGPTVILPGTQYHNTPTSLMASYMNFRHQIPLTVPAGTIAITHYDLWHCWMDNRSNHNRRMLKFLFNRTSQPYPQLERRTLRQHRR